MIKKRFDFVEREQIVEKAQDCLWSDSGKQGRDYLFLVRGISEETARAFNLGYLPVYVKHQLCGRIIFPLYDPSGNLVVVGSRLVDGNSSVLPTHWHESYQKSFYLYGIHLSKSFIRRSKFVIVVEGQFDVMQLYNHGVKNIVGLGGTNMSSVQISVINRYCKEIVLLLDTDENKSGQRGAEKVLDSSSTYQVNKLWDASNRRFPDFPSPWYQSEPAVTVERNILSVTLPENCDPDEFVRKHGIDELRRIIKEKRRESCIVRY